MKTKIGLLIIVAVLLPILPVYCEMIDVDIDTLWEESDIAILGYVKGIQPFYANKTRGIIYRVVEVSVEEYFIQKLDESTVRIRIEGGEIGSLGLWVEDQPEFNLGEHVFVFLRVPDEIEENYDYEVYAGFQGKFNVEGNKAVQVTGKTFEIPKTEENVHSLYGIEFELVKLIVSLTAITLGLYLISRLVRK